MPTGPDISKITEDLFISAWPKGEHRSEIKALGIQLILSMHWVRPEKSICHPPVELLWLPTADSPFTPIPMKTLWRGVEASLPVIERGGKIMSHCRAGRHRSVVMACAVLIAQGSTAKEAMALVKERRPAADPYLWYIRRRINKFEIQWNDRL